MRRNPAQTSDLESNILKHVRAANGISRVELARTLGLSPSTAGIYVERLISEGFLEEAAKAERETGRPPMLLRLNPEGGEFVGVDFEARNIMAVAVDFSDRPLRNARCQITPDDSAADVVKKIERTVAEVLPSNPKRLLAIGVGVPGRVNSAEGVAVEYKFIANWKNVPLAKQLSEAFGTPVFLENNVRSMALAELWFGQGLGIDDFICIGIRSGVGLGMILNRRLYRGGSASAGLLGRFRCPPIAGKAGKWFGTSEKPGGGPELQEVASLRAMQRAIQKAISLGEKSVLRGRPQPVSLEDLVAAVQQRDALALAVIGEAGKSLGWAVAHLTLLVDPAKVILAGPLTMLGDILLQSLRTTAKNVLAAGGLELPTVVNSTMGEFSGALGAAALAVHQWKPA